VTVKISMTAAELGATLPPPGEPTDTPPGKKRITEPWLLSVGGVRAADGGISFGRLEWRLSPPGWFFDGVNQLWPGPVTREGFRAKCAELGIPLSG